MGDMVDCAVGEVSRMLKVLPVKTVYTYCLLLQCLRLTTHYSLLTAYYLLLTFFRVPAPLE